MVATFKESIIDFADLKLSILCTNCNTEIIIDLSKSSSTIPQYCVPCKIPFSDSFIQALHDFHSAYETFTNKHVKKPFLARIRVQSELKEGL